MTGRYAHNTGVKGNVQPNGGYSGFSFRGAYDHNIATWLQGAGYRTIHIGKFLNGYGDEPYSDGKNVPPGWSSWHTVLNADTHHYFYGYVLNNDGVISEPYGSPGTWEPREYTERDPPGCPYEPQEGRPCVYGTDVFDWMAREEIRSTPPEQPFYMQIDYTAPHGDFRQPAGPEPPPRYYNWFKGAKLPHDRAEGLDEGNVSDKPKFIREAEHLTPSIKHTYKVYYDKQLEALRGIDDGVKEIIGTLAETGRLKNTYILFTSDNGFFFGEHRLIGGKFLAYEPATHLPFLIRGPGIKPGTQSGELAANIDIAPTVLDLAGVEPDKSVDGRSMVPFLRDPELRSRRPIIFESFVQTNDVEANGAIASTGEGDGGLPGGNGSTDPKPLAARGGRLQRPAWARRQGARLDPRSAAQLRGNPPRPVQVHRLARRREGALQHQQGPERAQQRRQGPEPLPDPQLPPPPAAALRELRRRRMPRADAALPDDAARIPEAAGAEAARTARTRTRTRKGTARTRKEASGQETARQIGRRLLDDGEDVAAGDGGALGDVQGRHLAGAVGGDLVLHLHRLDHADQVAL